MKTRLQTRAFGTITYDGQKVVVQYDSLSKRLTHLLDPAVFAAERVAPGEYTGTAALRFMAVIDHLGLTETILEAEDLDPRPAPPDGAPPELA